MQLGVRLNVMVQLRRLQVVDHWIRALQQVVAVFTVGNVDVVLQQRARVQEDPVATTARDSTTSSSVCDADGGRQGVGERAAVAQVVECGRVHRIDAGGRRLEEVVGTVAARVQCVRRGRQRGVVAVKVLTGRLVHRVVLGIERVRVHGEVW